MKKISLTFLLFLIVAGGFANAAVITNDKHPISTADSIRVFYKELFKALKGGYLDRKMQDWKKVEAETYKNLENYSSFKASLTEITNLFNKINATHCLVYRGADKYTVTRKIISKENYTAEWKRKYDTKPSFEVRLLDGKYGYILIPGMVFFDDSPENIRRLAQPLYDQIASIKTKHDIDGWIIDLRFNTGGNSTPMLLALYDLLGNQEVWGELNENKKLVQKYRLENGNYIQKTKTLASIVPSGQLMDKAKVAVITGIFTGSSGEVTALAFKGRPATIFVGENTAGYTTSNISFPLPFNAVMALTRGYDCDRNGVYYPYITPDVVVSKQDNFGDLMADLNIQEGIKFISGQ